MLNDHPVENEFSDGLDLNHPSGPLELEDLDDVIGGGANNVISCGSTSCCTCLGNTACC